MAQGSYIMRNVSGQRTEGSLPNFLGFDCDYQSYLDCIECVDVFQHDATIKRLNLKRRPRVAVDIVENAQTGGVSSGHWRSAESLLSSSGGDDWRLLGMSSTARGRPPLPPTHGSTVDTGKRNERPTASQIPIESKPQPTARSLSQRQSPPMEKTTTDKSKHPNLEVTSQPPPQPYPRRRLASFGGVSSPGSLSPFTGLGAYNHNNNGNKPTGAGCDVNVHLGSSLGSRGSTGCLMLSPQSSGRTTPVTGLGPVHLQHVRDQMVIALQRLKELEEQVKIIPILQVKISVLQEEKRQMVSQLKEQSKNEDVWKRSLSTEGSEIDSKGNYEGDHEGFKEFRELTEEMQALERVIKGGKLRERAMKSVSVGTDQVSKTDKHVLTDQVQKSSVGTEVSEINLGIYTELEAELVAQQLINGTFKERISQLEAELKESALQTELVRLKLELQTAGARNRVDKSCFARPSTTSTGTEVTPHTKNQGVGNHTELQDACSGEVTEVKTVGVSCVPTVKNACTGQDVIMSHWEVRERVETREKAVGVQVCTSTQGVGTEIKVTDAESNTENLNIEKEYRSVACGDCSVNVTVCERKKSTASRSVITNPVKGVELGIMASPQTTSQRTNTMLSSVSRYTNTRQAFSTDSSTNTLLNTHDKHTNTAHTSTRTVSVGNRAQDLRCAVESRTIGVGTEHLVERTSKPSHEMAIKVTRDTGVGLTDINENFLVGLKTRNMASGPSHLPDPVKTKSVGVGEGRVRNSTGFQQSTQQFQWDQDLKHYIEKMHWLLRDHGDLIPEPENLDQFSNQGNTSSYLYGNGKAVAQGGSGVQLSPQTANKDVQSCQLSPDSSKSDKSNSESSRHHGNNSGVKQMVKMLEQQTSATSQDRSTKAGKLRSVMKKKNGDHGCGGRNNRNNRMMGTAGCTLSERMFYACQTLKKNLSDDSALSSRELQDCLHSLQQEWFSVSSHKSAAPDSVEDHLNAFRLISPSVLRYIVNMADGNGNTALHYSISHSNFAVIKKLLDAEVCNVNLQNAAGYTPIMLSALAAVDGPDDMKVVEQLFGTGDVNAKASQAGQTALMLAVSHGRMDMVRALLAQGAKVNLQDDEGSTALMCASEHGHTDIVKLLLAQPDCDASLTDSDDSTAMSIALEAGHHDIAVLLYAHTAFSRGQTGNVARHASKPLSSCGGGNIYE
ncbi:KN motif and ankyrin repeat domain-containing protein 1b [Pholidichthys leucotaenia]